MGPVGKHPRPRVAVVGAGIAGLAAAAVLSRSFSVTVFERSTCAGGKIRRQTAGDQSNDCGQTVFTMSRVFEDVFTADGANLHEYV
ncbi:MAG: FAD-dependent oxidoreductase, partial [Pseudomonadota bacterium]